MRKVLIIARREFIEMAKTKAFLLSVFLVPLVVVAMIFLSGRLEKKLQSGPQEARMVAVEDRSGQLGATLEPLFREYNRQNPERQVVLELVQASSDTPEKRAEQMKRRVQSRALVGYLVIPENVLASDGRAQYYSRGDNIADMRILNTVRNLLNRAATERRCVEHGVSPQLFRELGKWVPIEQLDVGSGQTKKQGGLSARIMVPFFFVFLMFAGTINASQHLLTSIIEEKNSRVVELILSSVSPFQFMAGKIVGLAAIGFGAVCFWGLVAYGAATYRGIADIVPTTNIAYFLVFFVLGFLLFSSVFVAIGSACNTLKEAQSMMMPVMMFLIIPMMAWMYFSQHPNAPWTVALSFVPPFTPMVMMVRLAARPDLARIQVFGSLALLAVSVPLAVWGASRIFRVGILMYGKPAGLRELFRWLRAK
jgi:ABC-2 type transport system permease protein